MVWGTMNSGAMSINEIRTAFFEDETDAISEPLGIPQGKHILEINDINVEETVR